MSTRESASPLPRNRDGSLQDANLSREIAVPVPDLPGHFEWWSAILEIRHGHVRPYITYGGFVHDEVPADVMREAAKQWAEWLA